MYEMGQSQVRGNEDMISVTRKSLLSGTVRTRELDITQEQVDDWKSGTLVQASFPNLNANDREFWMTGITPEEWDEAFPEENEEEPVA